MKKFLFFIISLLLLTAVNASAITFDPFGNGGLGPNPTINITQWDWGVSSAVSVGANGITTGDDFELYTHGKISVVKDGATDVSGQLDASKEITFVTGFTETATSVTTTTTGSTATFAANPGTGPNFFEVYIDDRTTGTIGDDDLGDGTAGKGFSDGTLLFSGTISSSIGNATTFFTATGPLDQYDDGDGVIDDASATSAFGYNPQDTVTSGGFTTLQSYVVFNNFNPLYFPTVTAPLAYDFSTTTNNVIPFTQVDPANYYWDGSSYFKAVIGAVNGAPSNGPDILFQMDASTSQIGTHVIPEPTTFLLLGFGMLGLAGVARKRNV